MHAWRVLPGSYRSVRRRVSLFRRSRDRPRADLWCQGRRKLRDAERRDRPRSRIFGYRIGLIAGGFFTWPIGSHLDVQPEGLFSQQGATVDASGVDSVTIKFDSIVIPILVRYKLRSTGQGLVIFGGPSLGFKLKAKATANVGRPGND